MQGRRPPVARPSGAPTPFEWTQQSQGAWKRSMDRCGHIAFNRLHREYRRCSSRCRRDAIHLYRTTQQQFEIPGDRDLVFPVSFARIPSTPLNKNKRSPRASEANLLENAMFQVALWRRVQQFISSGQFWTSACRSVGPVRPSRPNHCFLAFPRR
jgi:hypothetical protein